MWSGALTVFVDADLDREAEIVRALRPMLSGAVCSRSAMMRVAAKLGVSVATLYRKRRLLAESGGLASSIEPRSPGVKPDSSFLRPDVEGAIAEVIEKDFLTTQRPHVLETVRRVHDRCLELEIPKSKWPSRTAIQRRLDKVGRF